MSMPTPDNEGHEPPALTTALDLLSRGLWPVAIHSHADRVRSPGKQPIGDEWGKTRPTQALLRATWAAHPDAGVGIKLGPESGVIDIDNDTGEEGNQTLLEMMAGQEFESIGWGSDRGGHFLAQYDPRFVKYGKTIIKIGGLEIRIGTIDMANPRQLQSVCPPSPMANGTPREWNGIDEVSALPESFFAYLDRAIVQPKPTAKPPATLPIYTPKPGQWSPLDRARAYIEKCPDAVRGQDGHTVQFTNAVKVRDNFGLSEDELYTLMSEWNAVHSHPPESDKGIRHKVADAVRMCPNPSGRLLNEDRPNPAKTGQSGGQITQVTGFVTSVTSVTHSLEEYQWDLPKLSDKADVENFPLTVFPLGLQELCKSISVSMGCPIDYPASFALALAGAAIGRSVNLRVKERWNEFPALFMAVVGSPGTKKSPPLRELAIPFNEIDRELRERFEDELAMYEQEVANCKATKTPAPPPPVSQQFVLDDATRESVVQIHAANRRGLALVNDELKAWVLSLDAYRNGKGSDAQFWMSLNSGSPVKSNRKGDGGKPLVIPQPCVAVIGPLTPSGLPAMKSSGGDDGWLDRIVFCFPDEVAVPDWSEEGVPEDQAEDWAVAIKRLWTRSMVRDPISNRERPFIIGFDPTAKPLWVAWYNSHTAERRNPDFPRSLRGPWSKMEGFTARFALILSQLHQAYDPMDNMARPRDVDALAMHGAMRLASYYKSHFRRAKGELSGQPHFANDCAEAMIRWLRSRAASEHVSEPFNGAEISRRFHRFSETERDEATHWLCSHRVMRKLPEEVRKVGQPGRPRSALYVVNPFLESVTEVTKPTETPREPGDEGPDWDNGQYGEAS